ncbi:MAG TPA: hypothetical protein DCY88_24165 [Cyanobacteria bacterium UBA11372]|nr:hypothetical protein [Cyanobacteria bacterium UBA11372]
MTAQDNRYRKLALGSNPILSLIAFSCILSIRKLGSNKKSLNPTTSDQNWDELTLQKTFQQSQWQTAYLPWLWCHTQVDILLPVGMVRRDWAIALRALVLCAQKM